MKCCPYSEESQVYFSIPEHSSGLQPQTSNALLRIPLCKSSLNLELLCPVLKSTSFSPPYCSQLTFLPLFTILLNRSLLSPSSYLFYFLGHTPYHVGSYFIDQTDWYSSKLPLFLEAWSLNHQIIRGDSPGSYHKLQAIKSSSIFLC